MDNFKAAKMHLLNTTLKKKKSYFEEELAKNTNKPKQPWDFKVTRSKFRQSKQIKHLS